MSSNGRTQDSGSWYPGSNPGIPATSMNDSTIIGVVSPKRIYFNSHLWRRRTANLDAQANKEEAYYMDIKIKKIIAREGLTILTLIVIGSIGFIVVYLRGSVFDTLENTVAWSMAYDEAALYRNYTVGLVLIYYIPYLLIRFIIWATKTVKQKSVVI